MYALLLIYYFSLNDFDKTFVFVVSVNVELHSLTAPTTWIFRSRQRITVKTPLTARQHRPTKLYQGYKGDMASSGATSVVQVRSGL